MTCNLPAHREWYQSYRLRFGRISFAGVKRVIRRTVTATINAITGESPMVTAGPELRPLLPQGLDGEDGAQVTHRFRARKTYCIQTLQHACGVPISWMKMYSSESPTQVMAFLRRTFPTANSRPSYIFYDNACTILAHVVTQLRLRSWLQTSRFLCDAWHYINHRSDDLLCRVWCNPAPADGSQPDLVINNVDEHGRSYSTRAFNTETAEQFNAWITSHEASLKQMSEYNFDFTVHCLLLIYREMMEARIMKRDRNMDDDPDGESSESE